MTYLVDSDWVADYLQGSFLHPIYLSPRPLLSTVEFLLLAIAGTSNAFQICGCSSRVAETSRSEILSRQAR